MAKTGRYYTQRTDYAAASTGKHAISVDGFDTKLATGKESPTRVIDFTGARGVIPFSSDVVPIKTGNPAPKIPDGSGDSSNASVIDAMPRQASQLSALDLLNLKPCCVDWIDFITMSAGQAVLDHDRFSRWLTEDQKKCMERKVKNISLKGAPKKKPKQSFYNYPKPNIVTPDSGSGSGSGSGDAPVVCPDILTIQANSWFSGGIFYSAGVFDRSASWSYVVRVTNQADSSIITEVADSFTGDNIILNLGSIPDGTVVSIYESFVDENGCRYCFTAEDVTINYAVSGGSTTLPIPLYEGECPSFSAGDDGGGGTSGETSGVTSGVDSGTEECIDPLEPFLVNVAVTSDESLYYVAVNNSQAFAFGEVTVMISPIDSGDDTSFTLDQLSIGETTETPLAHRDSTDTYHVTVSVNIDGCIYCASTATGIPRELIPDGFGLGVGVGINGC